MGYGNGGTTTSGNAGRALSDTPIRQSVIGVEMGRLEEQTQILSNVVVDLEQRINSILMAEPPSTAEKAPPQAHVPVPMGATLAQINERVQGLTGRLRTIIDRVEL